MNPPYTKKNIYPYDNVENLDLNSLFNLSYNFDLLKGIIEALLKRQKNIQKQLDTVFENERDKDKQIETLKKEIQVIRKTYVNREMMKPIENDLRDIKEHLKKHDSEISDSKFIYFYNIFF